MLLNAFLACGARHLSLINPAYQEDKALGYYDTATRLILDSLQNEHRDSKSTELCATTAIILNVYEIMSEKPLQRMNHIAGARALLKECGWDARTQGVGGACFWLNVSMEVLSCLRFKWGVAWHPDEWGVDMDFNRQCEPGREELWAHRITYILAKVACFYDVVKKEGREQTPSSTTPIDPYQSQKQYEEWCQLRDLCESWSNHIPFNMQPLAYLHPYQTSSKSPFPEVWIIKRCAIIARLFYHTALLLLAQLHPYPSEETRQMALTHAHQICGIAGHITDRGVASVTLRSLVLSGEILERRQEQQEVLNIISKIAKETGWRVHGLFVYLKQHWRWETPASGLPSPVPTQASLLQSTGQGERELAQQQQGQLAPMVMQAYASHGLQSNAQRQQQQQEHQQQRQQQQGHQQQQMMPQQERIQQRPPPLVNPLMTTTDLNSLGHSHPYHPHYQRPPQDLKSPVLTRHQYN